MAITLSGCATIENQQKTGQSPCENQKRDNMERFGVGMHDSYPADCQSTAQKQPHVVQSSCENQKRDNMERFGVGMHDSYPGDCKQ